MLLKFASLPQFPNSIRRANMLEIMMQFMQPHVCPNMQMPPGNHHIGARPYGKPSGTYIGLRGSYVD